MLNKEQKIKKLECGGVYLITLEPGIESIELNDFILSSEHDDDMTTIPQLSVCNDTLIPNNTLTQKPNQYNSYLGWYGVCKDGSNEEVEIAKFDKIFKVYQTKKGGGSVSYVKGDPLFLQTLTNFKPGNAYWVKLEPGEDSFIIDGFIFDENYNDNHILLDMNCDGNFSPSTPTPTPKNKIKFPVMLVGWEWPDRVDKMGRVRQQGGSNKFGDDMYLFDNFDYLL